MPISALWEATFEMPMSAVLVDLFPLMLQIEGSGVAGHTGHFLSGTGPSSQRRRAPSSPWVAALQRRTKSYPLEGLGDFRSDFLLGMGLVSFSFTAIFCVFMSHFLC